MRYREAFGKTHLVYSIDSNDLMIEKELFTVVEKTLSCGFAEDEKEIYENVYFCYCFAVFATVVAFVFA